MPEQLTQENNEKNKKERLEKILAYLENRELKGTAPYTQFKEAYDSLTNKSEAHKIY